MSILIAYFFVFLLAAIPFFEVVVVIPLGIASGLNSVVVTAVAFIGNMLTIWLLILLMDKVKLWLKRRKEKQGEASSTKRQERAARIWKKFGLPGLALISPLLIGSHLGTVLAMGFGGTRKQITVWMTASVFIWTLAIGITAHFGIDFLFNLTDREGFLVDLLRTE